MYRATALRGRTAIAAEGHESVDEVGRLLWNRQWVPAQWVRGRARSGKFAADQAAGNTMECAMDGGGSDAIEPGATIRVARSGEGRARELLGVQSIGTALR